MEVFEAILERRSIRRYNPQPIPGELITKILRAGMAAPSAGNEQPWQFIILDDRGILDRISEYHPHAQMFKEANVAIVVCGDMTLEKCPGFWVQDCSAAVENMLLEAIALGLGAVWVGVYPVEDRVRELKLFLGLPEYIIPLALLPLGYPAERKEPVDSFDESRIHINHW